MHIIGEKINGTRTSVVEAITERQAEFIEALAISQSEAGADVLDLNAGTHPKQEPADLAWLVETVQKVVDKQLCLDSANPAALTAAMGNIQKKPLINSISGESHRLEGILPIVAESECQVIALAMGEDGIPETQIERMKIVKYLMEKTRSYGIPDHDVFIDPLCLSVATDINNGLVSLDTIRSVHEEFPDVHITMGLSNISFGLPARSYINRAFITLAIAEGLDSAIIDPLDCEMQAAILSAEVVLGRDSYCLNFARAFRAGRLGPTDGTN